MPMVEIGLCQGEQIMPKRIAGAAALALALNGCGSTPFNTAAPSHGRYSGIGIYPADRTWTVIQEAGKPADSSSASVSDDSVVIVTIDGDTGEIRQCGNMSGFCVGLHPWSGVLSKGRNAPYGLSEHAPPKTYDHDVPGAKVETATDNTMAMEMNTTATKR